MQVPNSMQLLKNVSLAMVNLTGQWVILCKATLALCKWAQPQAAMHTLVHAATSEEATAHVRVLTR
jgi:hypothetical protein